MKWWRTFGTRYKTFSSSLTFCFVSFLRFRLQKGEDGEDGYWLFLTPCMHVCTKINKWGYIWMWFLFCVWFVFVFYPHFFLFFWLPPCAFLMFHPGFFSLVVVVSDASLDSQLHLLLPSSFSMCECVGPNFVSTNEYRPCHAIHARRMRKRNGRRLKGK